MTCQSGRASPIPSAGHRNVEQAHVFGQAFFLHPLHDCALVAGKIISCEIAVGLIVIKRQLLFQVNRPGQEEKRQEDNRVLQALGDVDGDDTDQVLVAFEPYPLAVLVQ